MKFAVIDYIWNTSSRQRLTLLLRSSGGPELNSTTRKADLPRELHLECFFLFCRKISEYYNIISN